MKTPLQQSIEHWEANLTKAKAGCLKRKDILSPACPLCVKHVVATCCNSCPVALATGFNNCDDTPWEQVYLALQAIEFEPDQPISTQRSRLIKAVEDEIAFLKFVKEPDE